MADNDRIKELMAGAEESPLLRYFKDEGERILQRNREEDWAKSRASAEAYKQKTFAEGAKKFFAGTVPSKETVKRLGDRAWRGLALSAEEALVDAMAPDESLSEFASSASEIGKLLQSAGGREALLESMKQRAEAVVRSPDAAVDLGVNVLGAVAAKKLPVLKNLKSDDVVVAAKTVKDLASTDYAPPLPVLGEKLKSQLAKGTTALTVAGGERPALR